MNHVPMCKWCGEHEVGSIGGSVDFCSPECEEAMDEECFEDMAFESGEEFEDDDDFLFL